MASLADIACALRWPNPEEISRTHEQIWDNDGTASQSSDIPQGQRTTLAALLALGAFLERQIDASERLYAAARASFLDVVELASIESVQLSLQMAMFEINTSRSNALWATLAVSVRLCLMLVRPSPALIRAFSDQADSRRFNRICIVGQRLPAEASRRLSNAANYSTQLSTTMSGYP